MHNVQLNVHIRTVSASEDQEPRTCPRIRIRAELSEARISGQDPGSKWAVDGCSLARSRLPPLPAARGPQQGQGGLARGGPIVTTFAHCVSRVRRSFARRRPPPSRNAKTASNAFEKAIANPLTSPSRPARLFVVVRNGEAGGSDIRSKCYRRPVRGAASPSRLRREREVLGKGAGASNLMSAVY